MLNDFVLLQESLLIYTTNILEAIFVNDEMMNTFQLGVQRYLYRY